jgi:RNA-binding protein YhbY
LKEVIFWVDIVSEGTSTEEGVHEATVGELTKHLKRRSLVKVIVKKNGRDGGIVEASAFDCAFDECQVGNYIGAKAWRWMLIHPKQEKKAVSL